MTPRQAELHDTLQLAIARLLGNTDPAVARERFLRLQCLLAEQRLVCNGMALARFVEYWAAMPLELSALHSPKLGALRELLASIVVDQGRKVVVFSQWRRMLQLAERVTTDVLGERGSVYFTGEETPRRRADSLARFSDDPDTRVLWSTDAGSLGLNLQFAANCCINLELPWNPAVLEQRVSRIYRLGQTAPVDVYNLVTVDGIEGRIARLLESKRAVFDGLFESAATDVRFDGDSVAPSALVLALATSSPTPGASCAS
jgi:SNF2 family DNA or RNA helicase